MSPSTCALIAQIVPVFLLAFAMHSSRITGSVADDVRNQPRRDANRWRRLCPTIKWAAIVILFLAYEFVLVLGAAEVITMPLGTGLGWFGLTLFYAAIEFWAGSLPPSGGNLEGKGGE